MGEAGGFGIQTRRSRKRRLEPLMCIPAPSFSVELEGTGTRASSWDEEYGYHTNKRNLSVEQPSLGNDAQRNLFMVRSDYYRSMHSLPSGHCAQSLLYVIRPHLYRAF